MTTISQHSLTARAVLADGILSPKAAGVTLDESWSPYVQARLTIAKPADALLEQIDPRTAAVRVILAAKQHYGDFVPVSELTALYGGSVAALTAALGGQSLLSLTAQFYQPWNSFGIRSAATRFFDLLVRDRTIDHETAEVVLELASDEARLQDYALVATVPFNPPTTSVRDLVEMVLARVGSYLDAGAADGTVADLSTTWLPGVSAWDYLAPLVQQAGLRLWCDESRIFHLTTGQEVPAHHVQLSYLETVTRGTDTVSLERDEWCDAVVITYLWTDDAGVQQRRYDTAQLPGFSKVRSLTYQTPYPGPGAAQQVLNRAQGKGRQQRVDAISDYAVSPGDSASIAFPGTSIQSGAVTSVTWSLPNDEMTVGTRGLTDTPSTAWILAAYGLTWASLPAGLSWTEYGD